MVNLLGRHRNQLPVRENKCSQEAVRRLGYPFAVSAWVTLPDHLHGVCTLPPDGADLSARWSLVKSGFSRALPKTERICDGRHAAGELGMRQWRYWEGLIGDEACVGLAVLQF